MHGAGTPVVWKCRAKPQASGALFAEFTFPDVGKGSAKIQIIKEPAYWVASSIIEMRRRKSTTILGPVETILGPVEESRAEGTRSNVLALRSTANKIASNVPKNRSRIAK